MVINAAARLLFFIRYARVVVGLQSSTNTSNEAECTIHRLNLSRIDWHIPHASTHLFTPKKNQRVHASCCVRQRERRREASTVSTSITCRRSPTCGRLIAARRVPQNFAPPYLRCAGRQTESVGG